MSADLKWEFSLLRQLHLNFKFAQKLPSEMLVNSHRKNMMA